MKLTIVMTYFERLFQLERTLQSITAPAGIDVDIIIVDDASPTTIPYIRDVNMPVTILKIEPSEKHWINPEPAYNRGIDYAIRHGADVLIIQNAENYHVGGIVERASYTRPDEWISFACYSLSERVTFSDHDIHSVIRSNNFAAGHDGQNAWYNHSVHRPVGYDFCAAMNVSTMIRLNGYDERFSSGCGYGDDDLLRRVKRLPGIKFTIVDDPFVVHQWHYDGFGVPENKPELVERNRKLFNELKLATGTRAHHIFTPDINN